MNGLMAGQSAEASNYRLSLHVVASVTAGLAGPTRKPKELSIWDVAFKVPEPKLTASA